MKDFQDTLEKQDLNDKKIKTVHMLVLEKLNHNQEIPNPEEDGEQSFKSAYSYLLLDMQKYTGNIDLLATYSSLVVNMFMHASTYTPVENHGKAQKREFDSKSQLQYFRSQTNHANAKLYKSLIKVKGDKTIRSPLNSEFMNFVEDKYFGDSLFNEIKKIDFETGRTKEGEEIDSYPAMERLAHAGARMNNFSILERGMMLAVNEEDDDKPQVLYDKLKSVIKPTKKIQRLSPQVLVARTNALLKRLQKTTPEVEPHEKLATYLLKRRIDRIKKLQQKASEQAFEKIEIKTDHQDVTCLMMRLYPGFNKEDDTYREGVTNVLLSFFAALLEHHANEAGLYIHTERRQSFGFLRPTITDAGNLTIRLSLGLEPLAFDEVILTALKDFEEVLDIFDFSADEDQHEAVQAVLELNPKEGKEYKKKKPDTYIRSSVRKDNKTLTTFRQAQAYLETEYKKDKTKNKTRFVAKAMEKFLNKYVRNGETCDLPEVKKKYNETVADSSAAIKLMENIVDYVFKFISVLPQVDETDPVSPFLHSYWHSLLKLYNHYTDALSLLKNRMEMPSGEFYRRAVLSCENMLEYLINLDGLMQARAHLHGVKIDPVDRLYRSELAYYKEQLDIPLEEIELYFTDSGQQAISTSILATSMMMYAKRSVDGKQCDPNIYLFGENYYEVFEFMDNVKEDEGNVNLIINIKKARIIFTDVTQIESFEEKYNKNQCGAMQALIIDMTHHPLLDKDHLINFIKDLHKKNCWIILVESGLKHEQLGLDKYQTGRIVTLAPPGDAMSKDIDDYLSAISETAMHPCIASYLQMVNAICKDKKPRSIFDYAAAVPESVSEPAAKRNGKASAQVQQPKKESATKRPVVHMKNQKSTSAVSPKLTSKVSVTRKKVTVACSQ